MMDTQVDRELLEKIADLMGKPVGAFNIRKDCGCDGRQSTEHIKIDDRTDGHAGIDIRILDGTKGETCHIPVIITKSGVEETVYNDFYIGEDCDVEIVAGCGIHNCGDQESRHDGIHTFHVGKNSHVHYIGKALRRGGRQGREDHEPPDHRVSGGGRLHPDGHRADPGRGLHQAVHQDRLRQGGRGRHHRAAADPRPTRWRTATWSSS